MKWKWIESDRENGAWNWIKEMMRYKDGFSWIDYSWELRWVFLSRRWWSSSTTATSTPSALIWTASSTFWPEFRPPSPSSSWSVTIHFISSIQNFPIDFLIFRADVIGSFQVSKLRPRFRRQPRVHRRMLMRQKITTSPLNGWWRIRATSCCSSPTASTWAFSTPCRRCLTKSSSSTSPYAFQMIRLLLLLLSCNWALTWKWMFERARRSMPDGSGWPSSFAEWWDRLFAASSWTKRTNSRKRRWWFTSWPWSEWSSTPSLSSTGNTSWPLSSWPDWLAFLWRVTFRWASSSRRRWRIRSRKSRRRGSSTPRPSSSASSWRCWADGFWKSLMTSSAIPFYPFRSLSDSFWRRSSNRISSGSRPIRTPLWPPPSKNPHTHSIDNYNLISSFNNNNNNSKKRNKKKFLPFLFSFFKKKIIIIIIIIDIIFLNFFPTSLSRLLSVSPFSLNFFFVFYLPTGYFFVWFCF